jgi:hypothetical protein
VHRAREALEVLVHEEILEEFRIGACGEDEPRRGDREEDCQTATPVQARERARLAMPQRVSDEGREREDDADQPLAEHGERHRGPGREHPGGLRATRAGLAGEQIGEHGAVEEQAHAHVERVDARHDDEVRARQQRQRAEGARVAAEERPPREPCDDHRAEAGQRGPEARGPFRGAEGLVCRGGGPVLERRLLEVGEAVQPRRHPVAGREHLARDLGVAALVRMRERPVCQLDEPERQDDGEREHEVARGPRRKRAAQDGRHRSGASPGRAVSTI